jgi:(S)-2-hydroxyglutarate dehydrogenase
VGLATALRLQERLPATGITVLEKEKVVARHQSGHNSGVLHAGLYYRPGSAKALLAVAGLRQMVEFCESEGVKFEICGKLVVAVDEDERQRLRALLQRGTENGLRGLELLTGGAMRELEPHVGGIEALRVPEEGIVDYPGVAAAMARRLSAMGGQVLTESELLAARREGGRWLLESRSGDLAADYLITCAGLHADRVCALTGERPEVRIVPFRGEYHRLRPASEHLVRHLIYPVPDPRFPFLGVHFTRMVAGGVEAGPNAVLALSREGYSWGNVSIRDFRDAVSFPGLWRFIGRHPAPSAAEIARSISRRRFAASLRRLVPEIRADDLEPGGAGVRAQAMRRDGSLVEDFLFVEREGVLHVLNAPSPAATASLAIGGKIAQRVAGALGGTSTS